ncbi:MAG: conjugal transfer protein TraF, partial [Planctomycetota bacterium]
ETYNYAAGVASFEDGNVLDEFRRTEFHNHFTDLNLDVGFAYELQPGATIGLAALNVFRDSYTTRTTGGRQFTYWIEPRPTAGVALSQLGLTFTADLDLIKSTRFRGVGDSQFIRMGLEYDALGWGQLRAGFSHDFGNTIQDVFTFGLGVSPAETVRLDLAGLLGDHSAGASIQLSLTL